MPRRVDANHWSVVATFKRLGWFVVSTADMGSGFPDLFVAKSGVMRQIEVKDGAKPPSKRKLTPDEVVYHRDLAAVGCPVLIIESDQQVVEIDLALHGHSACEGRKETR